jgi:hypothetical protein
MLTMHGRPAGRRNCYGTHVWTGRAIDTYLMLMFVTNELLSCSLP